MLVTFYGVRGSTPCHGDEIARYGGNTSCVSITVEGEQPLLFDLGTGLRYFGLDQPDDVPFVGSCLLSHLHWDHVQGLPFFTPMQHPDARLTIYAPPQTGGRTASDEIHDCIRPPLFPVTIDDFPGTIDIREATSSFRIGGFEVVSSSVPHVGPTRGYRVNHGSRSVAYISDHQQPANGVMVDEGVRELCADVDLLIHDAQYTPAEFAVKKTWGHCTVEYAVWLAGEVGAKRLALFHHDPTHDDDMLDRLVGAAQQCGTTMGLEVIGASEGLVIDLAT